MVLCDMIITLLILLRITIILWYVSVYVLLPPPTKKRALADCQSMILNDHLKFDIDCINKLYICTYLRLHV